MKGEKLTTMVTALECVGIDFNYQDSYRLVNGIIFYGYQLNSTQLQLYSFTFNLQLHDSFHPRIGEPNRGGGRDTQI